MEHIKVKLNKHPKIIAEILTRTGIPNKHLKKLYQSCHLVEKNGEFYIYHFKELFEMSRGESSYDNMSKDDYARKECIILMLIKWGFITCDVVNSEENDEESKPKVFVLPYKEKKNWELVRKFNENNLGGLCNF